MINSSHMLISYCDCEWSNLSLNSFNNARLIFCHRCPSYKLMFAFWEKFSKFATKRNQSKSKCKYYIATSVKFVSKLKTILSNLKTIGGTLRNQHRLKGLHLIESLRPIFPVNWHPQLEILFPLKMLTSRLPYDIKVKRSTR